MQRMVVVSVEANNPRGLAESINKLIDKGNIIIQIINQPEYHSATVLCEVDEKVMING